MLAISPRLGEFFVKTTKSKDVEAAFQKVIADYLELKLKDLHETIKGFEAKWGMTFEEFKAGTKNGSLENAYSFNVERDYWQWEEIETLKHHYETLRNEWI